MIGKIKVSVQFQYLDVKGISNVSLRAARNIAWYSSQRGVNLSEIFRESILRRRFCQMISALWNLSSFSALYRLIQALSLWLQGSKVNSHTGQDLSITLQFEYYTKLHLLLVKSYRNLLILTSLIIQFRIHNAVLTVSENVRRLYGWGTQQPKMS